MILWYNGAIKYMKNIIIILVVIVLAFGFYWYQIRPEQIRKECYELGAKSALLPNLVATENNPIYKNCLAERGVEN